MRHSLLLTLFLLVSFLAFAQPHAIPMDPHVRYGRLDNGLTYYIRHNDLPSHRAHFYIVQNVGAILEQDSQNGLAHFLEHMAFNGTRNFPDKGIIDYMQSIGAKFGANLNAYTSLDETVYTLKNIPVPRPSVVDSALLILHDQSSFILLLDHEIDKERGVIREEWRQGATANRRLWAKGNKLKYPGSQYAKRDVIGDTAVINNFPYDTLRAYYRKWYRPDLQAIVVVGDVNADSVEQSLRRIFADILRPSTPPNVSSTRFPTTRTPSSPSSPTPKPRIPRSVLSLRRNRSSVPSRLPRRVTSTYSPTSLSPSCSPNASPSSLPDRRLLSSIPMSITGM